MISAMLPALLLAASTAPAADREALDQTVAAIFAPYNEADMSDAAWERPIYSRVVTALIARWEQVMPEDEVDDLNDGDWLCQCQDWDPRNFRVKSVSYKQIKADAAEIEVDIDIGWGEKRDALLVFRREEGKWMLDDLYSEVYSDGIKDALVRTIAADEALAK
jgi:hypothetical protein